MQASPRITLKDIAARAGVHLSTVSLALRDHPRIPQATRDRIRQAAAELSYEPDPMLSALAIYRDRSRPKVFHGTLAWLGNTTRDFNWRDSSHYSNYFKGASHRARDYGFNVDIFDFSTPVTSPQRLSSIFRARNINGLLICPHPTGYTGIDFPWSDSSLITFGYSMVTMTSLRLNTVASAHYRNMRRAMREVYKRGYRRVGLVIEAHTDMVCDYNISAAYMLEQSLSGERSIPVYRDLRENHDGFKPWMKRHKVEVVITTQGYVRTLLEMEEISSGKVALVNLTLPGGNSHVSGMIEDDAKIGSVAADLLIAAIHRGERGIPLEPRCTHLEGVWHEGKTLPGIAG